MRRAAEYYKKSSNSDMENEKIKVSVLMLAYNQEQYIDEAIRSVVLQQTTHRFELIVADDASTDSTRDHILRWKNRYPDIIRLLPEEKNLGLARNFIRAYNAARGEYIAICESDDFWTDRHKLQLQVDFMDTHTAYTLCFHRVVNYYQADGSMSLSNGRQGRILTLNDLALCNPITNVSVLYRRSVAGALPEWMTEVTSYDFVMHMLCAQYGDIYYMKRVMAVYRKLPTSIWTGGDKARRSMISRKNRDLLIGYFQSRNAEVAALLRLANARNCLDMAAYYEQEGQADKAQESLRLAQSYQPEWTDDDIRRERELLLRATSKPSRLRRCLTRVRQALSRLLPVPRISG